MEWKSDAWTNAYGVRVRALLQRLAADSRQVVWLEVTTADRPRLESKLVTIRAVQRAVIEGFGARASYLHTEHHLRDERGVLRSSIELGGRTFPLRIDDGVHFTAAGGAWLARRVEAELLARFGLDAGVLPHESR